MFPGWIPFLYCLLAHISVNPASVQPQSGSLTWYSSSHLLLSLLPCCIMLSMNVAMACGQHRRPVPYGKVRLESVPQRSSLWCDKHAVGCQVSDNSLLRVPPLLFFSPFFSPSPHIPLYHSTLWGCLMGMKLGAACNPFFPPRLGLMDTDKWWSHLE